MRRHLGISFVAVLVVLGVAFWRGRVVRTAALYVAAAAIASGGLLLANRLEGLDPGEAGRYQWHTFLDSTPESWLTPECRANPTENCREADGLSYFGPANLREGVFVLAMNHPFTTLEKSIRSAWDNTWILVGPNLSTFPATIPFLLVVVAILPEVRRAYRQIPRAVFVGVAAIMAESVLPPLTWAPPHPQYHVALVLPMVVLLVPVLLALLRLSRARWLAIGFLVVNAGLSAFRYSRYPGY